MNKPFLLIAGSNYYPESGTGDWIDCFSTEEEARSQVSEKVVYEEFYEKGRKKGQIKDRLVRYVIDDRDYDWYTIVNLETWTKSGL